MAFHCILEVIKNLSETPPRICDVTFERNVPRVLPQKSPNISILESEGYFTEYTLQQSCITLKQSTAYTKLPRVFHSSSSSSILLLLKCHLAQ